MRTRDDLSQVMQDDLVMNGADRWRPWFRISKGTLFFLRLLRFAEYHDERRHLSPWHRVVALVARIRLRRQSERLGFEVPLGAVGPGFSIAHSGLLVIADDARIGARCRIHQGVTVGRGNGGAPVIGDDVFIGPNAVVLGGIVIGDGAFVYPGAVCVTDVPAGHGARGVPATIFPLDAPSRWRPDVAV